jgi:hypothetical protein
MSSYTLEIIGSIAQAQKEFAKIPGFTESAAAKAAVAWAKNQEKIRRDAEKTAKKIASEMDGAAEQAGKSFGALKTIGEKSLGGIVGDLADVGGALASLGPAGLAAVAGLLAIGGAAVGITATVGAVIELERAALGYAESLSEIESLDLVSPEQREQIIRANAALDSLGVVVQALAVALAAELGPAVADAAIAVADLGLAGLDMLDSFLQTRSLLEELAIFISTTFTRVLLLPLEVIAQISHGASLLEQSLGMLDGPNTKLYQQYTQIHRTVAEMVTGFDGLKDSTDGSNTETSRARQLIEELMSKMQEGTTATHGAAGAHRQAADATAAHAAALASLGSIMAEAGEDQLSDFERSSRDIVAAYDRRTTAAQEAFAKSAQGAQELAALEAALNEAAARRDRDFTELQLQDLDRRTQAEMAAMAALEAARTAEREREQGALDAAAAAQAARDAEAMAAMEALQSRFTELLFERIGTVHETMIDERKANIAALEERLAGDERLTAAQRQSLNERLAGEKNALTQAARAQRAAAAFQILLQGALAMVQAVAVAPPPFNAVTIAAQAALVALNTAAALAAPLPKFHSGSGRMAPDEQPAVLRRGEAVLSERAVQELNRGNTGVLNQPQVQQIYWNGRLMSEVVGMALATPGPARRFVEARIPAGRGYRG